jgi:hypothetical protein
MKMSGYFALTWLIIMIVSFLVSRLLLIDYLGLSDDDNVSWLDIFSGITFVFTLRFVFFLSLSSITIFLNLFKKIRSNWFLSLLTYLLIPVGTFLSIVFGDIFEESFKYENLKSGFKFAACVVLPHLAISLLCFLHFRRLMQKGKLN